MKMNGKKLIGVLLAVVTATACLSCGKKTQTSAGVNGSIDVTYYEGGTGKVWIEKIAADFEAETGVKVNLTPDPMATENALTLLESGRNLPDLMFILYTNWTKYVQNGWLAEMDDLYDGTFSASYEVNGKTNTLSSLYGTEGTTVFSDSGKTQGVTLKDILIDDFEDYGYSAKTVDSEKHYYILSWTAPCTGFVYNVDLLREVGYENAPETEAEFKDCCAKLVAKGIAPFAWGGEEIAYWDFPVETWWAQYSGVEKWRDFYNFESADVYADEGRTQALRLWQELIVDSQTGDFINSIEKPMGKDHNDAQRAFVMGKAAFAPTGSWVETEVKDFIKDGFEMKMMAVPSIEGAKTDENGKPIRIQNTSAGDFACIPKDAANVEGAKAFLAFMNRPEYVDYFSKETGIPRAFNYHPSEIEGITSFSRSCFDLFESSRLMFIQSSSPLYTYAGLTKWTNKYGSNIYGNLSGSGRMTAEAISQDMYDYARKMWSTWVKAAGL